MLNTERNQSRLTKVRSIALGFCKEKVNLVGELLFKKDKLKLEAASSNDFLAASILTQPSDRLWELKFSNTNNIVKIFKRRKKSLFVFVTKILKVNYL